MKMPTNRVFLEDGDRDRFQEISIPKNAIVVGTEDNGSVADLTPADSLAVLNAALAAFGVADKSALRPVELVAFDDVEEAFLAAIAADGGLGDIVQLGAGNDGIDARSGNDVVFGGDGNDRMSGGAGIDVLVGDKGNDVLGGGAGDDILFGNAGNDVLFGGAGDDRCLGGSGNDVINGGAGDDTAYFNGEFEDYAIAAKMNGNGDTIVHLRGGPDGKATLINIETLFFADGAVDIGTLFV